MPQPPFSRPFRIRICGEAGEGISTAGELLLYAAIRSGLQGTCVKYLPSNIRGGLAESLVTLGADSSFSPVGACDVLVVVSRNAGVSDVVCVNNDGVVLVVLLGKGNAEPDLMSDLFPADKYRVIPVPIAEIVSDAENTATKKTMAALGIVGQLLHIDITHFDASISNRFREAAAGQADSNRNMIASAYVWAVNNLGAYDAMFSIPIPANPVGHDKTLVIDGNEAIALGAIAAGCTFFASYPITPATSIGETLARLLPQQGGCAYQAEDEMAALGAVIGASFAGVKALTATSGPGLSLMQEFVGYASMTEIPAVIVDVQRVGPSTGMPTRHGQDDLLAAVFGGHGEGPRIVLAPQSVGDCFTSTVVAFNCAEKYQCPVIVLSDASLGLMKKSVPESALICPKIVNRETVVLPDENGVPFRRYRCTDSGGNPMPEPGVSRIPYRMTGVEHTEDGSPAATAQERRAQVEKRSRKLLEIETEINGLVEWDLETDGGSSADIGVIAWGFTVAATRDAVAQLRRKGYRIAALYPRLLYPLCTMAIGQWASSAPLQIVIEANSTGQLCSLIGMTTGVQPHSYAVASGEPLTPEEIIEGIERLLLQRRGRGA